MMSLKKTALWLGLLALVVKLSGFLRESIIAYQFGVSSYTDGYLLAFSFITLVIAMIAGGFNNVFLPMYVKKRKENPEQTDQSANGVMNVTFLLFIVISIIGFILAPWFVPLIFGNMPLLTEETAVSITQFFFVFMSFIALTSILDSYLQGRRVFVPSQIAKLLQTIVGVAFALLFSEQWGIASLAYGFMVGTILGIFVQFFYLYKTDYRWQPVLSVDKEFQQSFLVLLAPALLSSVVGQINVFVNKGFASGIGEGPVSYLNYAQLLSSIPHTIYATTIAVIIFTLLAEQVNDRKSFQNTFFSGMQISLLTLSPIAAGLYVVGEPALSFIYERGKFTAEDTHHTYIALIYYLPMIVTQGMQYIVAKAMYAQGKTKIVFRISVFTIAINVLLNWLFIGPFGYPGLALTSSLVSLYYLTACTIFVYKDFDKSEPARLIGLLVRTAIVTVFMVLPLYFIRPLVDEWYSLWQLAILVPIGAILYVVGLFFFYKDGFRKLLSMIRRNRSSLS
ncbi:murein biosynthesis integral membrane protein MurJ [Domibacillus mangrovi]|uniref:Lipid II flippase n=2 Tax=Domibacillus mangrovi TaxID=1714354 RepID=A0A1Q5P674_9BACI|nr:murein biosynthesis integral membrane protein MurJ [Domibacillus mangrovi]